MHTYIYHNFSLREHRILAVNDIGPAYPVLPFLIVVLEHVTRLYCLGTSAHSKQCLFSLFRDGPGFASSRGTDQPYVSEVTSTLFSLSRINVSPVQDLIERLLQTKSNVGSLPF